MTDKQEINHGIQLSLQSENKESNKINSAMSAETDRLSTSINCEKLNDELILQEIWGDVEKEIIKYKDEDDDNTENDIKVALKQFSTSSNKYGEVERSNKELLMIIKYHY